MSRCKRAFPVSTRPSAFQEAVQQHNTSRDGDDEADNANVAYHATHNADIVLGEVKAEVLVASGTENFPRLDDLSGQAIAMVVIIRAFASLYELWSDSKK